jgi:hypothetical protein
MIEAQQAVVAVGVPTEPRVPRNRVRAILQPVLLVAAALAQVALAIAWIDGAITVRSMCGLHLAVSGVAALGPAIASRKIDARAAAVLLTLSMLGPFGALALLIERPRAHPSRGRCSAALASTGHESRAEAVCSAIRQGRRLHARPVQPIPFADVLAGPDRRAQNAALRAISRKYHPSMLPALRAALSSEAPAVRVQAAAVYGKLSGVYGAQARALLTAGPVVSHSAEARSRAADCRTTAASGFVDRATAEALLRLAAVLDALERAELRKSGRQDLIRQASIPSIEVRPGRVVAQAPLKRHACGGIA